MRFAVIIFVLKGIHQLSCLLPTMLMKHHKTPVRSVYNAQSKIPRLIFRRKRTLRDCWSCFSKVNAFFYHLQPLKPFAVTSTGVLNRH